MCERFCRLFLPLLAGMSTLMTGCSGGSSASVYPVKGTVLVEGKPASYAKITLIPVDETKRETCAAVGTANENGAFALWTREPKGKHRDGAKAGEYFVTVSWRIPDEPRSSDTVYSDELLPPRFQDPKESGLKVEITPNKRELEPFDLVP